MRAARAQILAPRVLDWRLGHYKEKLRVSGPGWKEDDDITAGTVVGASQTR